ncbi:hypothetical protein CUJ83_10035 [Methanocella sp. CWC-04]|uniref:Uncharacterized protein n=1 Tax=Methanooceanicella nereidis TaxID=2052831 RepID=A0AAP2RD97_9EURY|nr:Sjogren's syndrome/scleroderma autoantigen 1 family protein [Methanocella sp. CWC-04]MCD1295338.1 hypothetical protein [Methanocella sp. CWC-04]
MAEEDLEKITKMLERGGTMLAKHCDCGAPLFKYKGKILCPVCDSKKEEETSTKLAVPVETKPALTPQPSLEAVKSNRMIELPEKRVSLVIKYDELEEENIEAVIISKINDITARLAREEYPDKIQMYLDILETSMRVLRELRGLSR